MTGPWIGAALLVVFAVSLPASAVEPLQASFSRAALDSRLPVAEEFVYAVNARIRPLLLFWINRDDIGDALLTRREAVDGRRALEFLIGSDPARAPRKINRWGYIAEELGAGTAEVLGVMSESNEQTLDEARARIEREEGLGTFKAARATMSGGRAVGGTMTVTAPAHLTYRDLDALLTMIPATPSSVRTVELPSGTQTGFLVAIASLLRASAEPCRAARGGRPRNVASIPYMYNQTIYDLTLTSCKYETDFRRKAERFADVVDGDFVIRNRTTKSQTDFRIVYGASGALLGISVRAIFRPRWWLEIELLLQRTAQRGAQDVR